ncbi:MAG: hypothetical protein E7161_01410 [Firmicutes bacterium]|nr:hypothetical protein [Bacillota bacterium]
MFGKNLIIGHSEGKISDKGRIFLPSFTKPEKDDKILIQKDTYGDEAALKLIAYSEYLNMIERYRRLRDTATSLEEEQKYTKKIEDISLSLTHLTKVDAQRRIQLPKAILEKYNWSPQDTIRYDGLGESLLIRKK